MRRSICRLSCAPAFLILLALIATASPALAQGAGILNVDVTPDSVTLCTGQSQTWTAVVINPPSNGPQWFD